MVSIIPKPVLCELNSEVFHLNEETTIFFSPAFSKEAEYLKNFLSLPTGFHFLLQEVEKSLPDKNAIIIQMDSETNTHGNEGYILEITSNIVIVRAHHSKGAFYAIQTLRQLLPLEIESKTEVKMTWDIPGIKIVDYPRFSWRGFMFDECRHFHGKTVVKRMLDLMALHKLNVFHWHLTEDQGWRIEVKKYHKLTDVGAWRKGSQIGGYRSFLRKKRSTTPHGGYYTQEDIQEIVEYAKDRYIMVVPEIDLPGHTRALLAAYPEYSCTGGPFEVATDWGIFKDVLCPGKDQIYNFIEDLFREVAPLFPSPFFHIGGDETPTSRWKVCPECQKRIRDEDLPNEKALQEYFTSRLVNLLKDLNKVAIGWNEILPDQFENLDSSVVAQHWLGGSELVKNHLRKGRKMIISRFFYTYLDYPYTMTSLKKCYQFDPIPKGLEPQFSDNILGLSAQLWTEWVPTLSRIDWQVFPRLTALAEVAWSQQKKDYIDFRQRLRLFLLRLEKLGVKYARESVVDPGKIKRLFNLPLMFFRDPQKNTSD